LDAKSKALVKKIEQTIKEQGNTPELQKIKLCIRNTMEMSEVFVE
jgi:hypothetical protein